MASLTITKHNIDKLPAPLISRWREKMLQPMQIELAQNSYDLRPAAYAIANRMEAAKTVSPDKTLIAPMGEHHHVVLSQLLQSAVMKELRNRGFSVSSGAELSHRNFEIFFEALELSFSRAEAIKIQEMDAQNLMLLQAALILVDDQRFSQNFLFCRDNGIAVHFVDAARKYVDHDIADVDKAVLDYSDCKTRMNAVLAGYKVSIEQLEAASDDDLNSDDLDVIDHGGHNMVSKAGFHIRNMVMAQNIQENIARQKPDIFVLGTGQIHVLGTAYKGSNFVSPYAHSLTSVFRRNACNVVPAGIKMTDFAMPADVDLTSYIELTGLPQDDDTDIDTAIKKTCDASGDLLRYYAPIDEAQRTAFKAGLGEIVDKVTKSYKKLRP